MPVDCKHVGVCGKEVVEISIRGHKWCGANTICYLSVCPSCAKVFEDMGLVVCSDEETDEWTTQGKSCCGMC